MTSMTMTTVKNGKARPKTTTTVTITTTTAKKGKDRVLREKILGAIEPFPVTHPARVRVWLRYRESRAGPPE